MSIEAVEQHGIGHTLIDHFKEIGTNFPNFVREYLLILRLQLPIFRSRKIPEGYSNGNSGDVVILPGYSERWHYLKPIADYLNHRGFRIHILEGLERTRNFGEINDYTRELEEYLVRNDIENCIIVAHSKGGLIAITRIEYH